MQYVLLPLVLLAGDGKAENPWAARLTAALEALDERAPASAWCDALDAAWRADDWRAGLKLAGQARAAFPDDAHVTAAAARALRRAGRLEEAEQLADALKPLSNDPIAQWTLLTLHSARGETEPTRIAIAGLERLRKPGATELFALYSIRQEQQRLAGLPKLLERATALADPANGYPEVFIGESLEGLPDFYRRIGPQPVNEISRHGAVAMPMAQMLRLPYCEAMVNGKGPYRLVVDTGGSITLSLDTKVAEELELPSLGESSVRGVSGKQKSGQALVDVLTLGGIECRRVLTRTFDMPDALRLQADGVLGAGVFSQARMTLDFKKSQLVIGPSTDVPAAGVAGDVRLIGDAKILAGVNINDRRIWALIDSGANVAAIAPSLVADLFPGETPRRIPVGVSAGVGEGGDAGVALTRGVAIDVWGRRFDNYSGVSLGALDDPLSAYLGVQTFALLGMPILRELETFTIDYPRRRLWIRWIESGKETAKP